MKKALIRFVFGAIILSVGSAGIVSCSGNPDSTETQDQLKQTEEENEDSVKTESARHSAPEGFQEATQNYLALKDGLVESKGAEAQLRANEFLISLQKTDASSLESAVAAEWTNMANLLQNDASTIAGTTDLAKQREAFTSLSNHMITTVKLFGADDKLYLQHCPMANKNTGGSWLSSRREIRNPYYGDAMLTCGEVQAEIQKKRL